MPVVLHVTSARDTTTDLVLDRLEELGIDSVRLNTESFPTAARLSIEWRDGAASEGRLITDSNRVVRTRDVGAVYYRRPLPPSYANIPHIAVESRRFAASEAKAGLSGFLSLLDAEWVDKPSRVREAESKARQLRVAQDVGFEIPRTLISNDEAAVARFIESSDGACVVAKSVHSPLVDRQLGLMAYTSRVTVEDLSRLADLQLAPVIFQDFVEKTVEYRVTVVGRKVFAVAIYSQEHDDASTDWRKVDYRQVRHEIARLDSTVEARCRSFLDSYGLHFAAIDLVQRPDGSIVFLECNPVGEWAWLEAATGSPIASAVAHVLADLCEGAEPE